MANMISSGSDSKRRGIAPFVPGRNKAMVPSEETKNRFGKRILVQRLPATMRRANNAWRCSPDESSVRTATAAGKTPTVLRQAQARTRTQGGQRNALAAGGPGCTPHSAAGNMPTALPGPCKRKTRSEERVLRVTEAAGSDQLFQFRQDLEQVAHQAVVGHLEDRGFLVLVDRDDHLGVLHARQVLDGTGDAHGDVQ